MILDLGATLVMGPDRGPASRIAERAGLGDDDKRALHDALMTTPFAAPGEIARLVGGGAAAQRAIAEVWEAQCGEARPIVGAAEALRALVVANDLRFAVISNIWPPYLSSVRDHFAWFLDDHVEEALQLYSFRERRAKPDPQLFERALDRAGVEPEAAVMIGDSHAEDVEPAARLGLRTVWLLHRPEREAPALARVRAAQAPAPTLTLDSIAELTPEVVAATAPRGRLDRVLPFHPTEPEEAT